MQDARKCLVNASYMLSKFIKKTYLPPRFLRCSRVNCDDSDVYASFDLATIAESLIKIISSGYET